LISDVAREPPHGDRVRGGREVVEVDLRAERDLDPLAVPVARQHGGTGARLQQELVGAADPHVRDPPIGVHREVERLLWYEGSFV
jgi:microcystin degradation protein MlrC